MTHRNGQLARYPGCDLNPCKTRESVAGPGDASATCRARTRSGNRLIRVMVLARLLLSLVRTPATGFVPGRTPRPAHEGDTDPQQASDDEDSDYNAAGTHRRPPWRVTLTCGCLRRPRLISSALLPDERQRPIESVTSRSIQCRRPPKGDLTEVAERGCCAPRTDRQARSISGYLMLADAFDPRPGSGEVSGGSLANRLPSLEAVAREWHVTLPGAAGGEWLERGMPRSK